ncbi:unnamed protein product, partial [marine sediment metagenome]
NNVSKNESKDKQSLKKSKVDKRPRKENKMLEMPSKKRAKVSKKKMTGCNSSYKPKKCEVLEDEKSGTPFIHLTCEDIQKIFETGY